MSIVRIEYQVTGDGICPSDGGAISVLGVCATAMADDIQHTVTFFLIVPPVS